uniref:Uncharacterized protein n=1 Tax=Chelonoidis abingdonii TaxID=106734 RepID=A0A8C0FZT0_CHEAB
IFQKLIGSYAFEIFGCVVMQTHTSTHHRQGWVWTCCLCLPLGYPLLGRSLGLSKLELPNSSAFPQSCSTQVSAPGHLFYLSC